ncbi:hypothetical protein AGMMS49992_16820 [Clostridia bacterium]|nr:hypothetical protein AGMMS49992_16820 [Clostridia bacterium]
MRIEYTNKAGRSIQLAAPVNPASTPYWVTELRGLHGVEVDNRGLMLLSGDGEAWLGSLSKARVIRVSGTISGAETVRERMAMLETMVPCEISRLTVTRDGMTRGIDCFVDKAPQFDPPRGDRFTFELWCPDPYWQDAVGDQHTDFKQWTSEFEFPVSIDGDIGFIWGELLAKDVIQVINHGQVASGFVWTARILDPVSWVRLTLIESQEKIEIYTALNAGDTVRVSTHSREKWVRIWRASGGIENAMQYITPDFSFFKLRAGVNTVKVETSEGDAAQEGEIRYKNRYLGI